MVAGGGGSEKKTHCRKTLQCQVGLCGETDPDVTPQVEPSRKIHPSRASRYVWSTGRETANTVTEKVTCKGRVGAGRGGVVRSSGTGNTRPI